MDRGYRCARRIPCPATLENPVPERHPENSPALQTFSMNAETGERAWWAQPTPLQNPKRKELTPAARSFLSPALGLTRFTRWLCSGLFLSGSPPSARPYG